MARIVHPLTKQTYESAGEGLVKVTDPASGQWGLFDSGGRWHEGEMRSADLQMLGWVGRAPDKSTGETS
jgi:hypothetical protein